MKNILQFLIYSWFVLACLGPDFKGPSSVNFRLEDVVLFILWIPFLTQHAISKGQLGFSRLFIILVSFLFFLVCLSSISLLLNIIFSVDVPIVAYSGGSVLAETLKELLRYSKYALIVYVFSLVRFDVWRRILTVIIICCFIIIAIQVMQYKLVPRVNEWITLIYGAGDETFVGYATDWAMNMGEFRAGSVFGSCNVLGAFLIIPFILFLMLSIKSFKQRQFTALKRIFLAAMTGFIFLGLFIAQSRSGFISCVAGAIVSLAAARHSAGLGLSTVVKFAGLSICVLVALLVIFSSSMTRYTSHLAAGFGGESMGVKKEHTMTEVVNLRDWQVIVGKGPALSIHLDSELGYITVWYGVLGLMGYYLFYFLVYLEAKRSICDGYIRSAFIGIIFAYVLLGIPSSGLLNIRVFPVFLALLTLAIYSPRNITAMQEVEPIRL